MASNRFWGITWGLWDYVCGIVGPCWIWFSGLPDVVWHARGVVHEGSGQGVVNVDVLGLLYECPVLFGLRVLLRGVIFLRVFRRGLESWECY